jgi:hypothetical protein
VREEVPEESAAVPDRRPRRPRRFRWLGLVALLLAGAVVAAVVLLPRGERPPGSDDETDASLLTDQRVVVWTIWDEKAGEVPFVAVMAAGGGLEPVAVAIPGNAAVSVPGHGLGTIEEVAAPGDVATVAATVENILGVRIDEAWGMEIDRIRTMVDGVGGIDAGFRHLDGAGVLAYLRDAPPVERAIRWQEVLAGLLEGLDTATLAGVPADVRPAFQAGDRDVLILPVKDVGSGLASPDDPAVAKMVQERFVPTGSAEKVRLVVLNGNGTPGIGTEVARLLVPEGFELVASTNADSFDQEVTVVVASSDEYLDDAQRAQRLLGVGEVRIGRPSGLADVLVVVGKDFRIDDAGGP